ncbi:hypothetical protein LOZ52_002370 [Ophidiomyces ophidiicola]|nr:hypothetical protein LOZ29_002150 [Ophidiomyces ophidiicola]KAI2214716.1 hypothetical protein LOZ15_004725 [Ophidiomyces ophidiicola]KAI2352221.1 hypothetical protein LOY92_002553 [Ophidiomyces ophidiicola]KAI2428721.1 hypothetical protein LOZ52_002370 [Ophidiomyces ophidiicola]KAI2440200.1 hypothetical protein LOZ08_004040 [Ophidiomyces ophidiicola]
MSGLAIHEEKTVPGTILLDYGCSEWRASSQRVADFYNDGVKLWKKKDFTDIEQQLAQTLTIEKFAVRRIDGSIVYIKNPMFGVQKPIWTPVVMFQEYWRLVFSQPNGPPEAYTCTYLIDWKNTTIRDFDGPFDRIQTLFENFQAKWRSSTVCDAFTSQFCKFLDGNGNPKKITKIICFGLGDLHVKPWHWWSEENNRKPENERRAETIFIEGALIHHAMALTIANVARSYAEDENIGIKLLTQDPAYTNESKIFLRDIGFELVGEYGAGGFAELDDKSIVFSAFASAPIQQIIADLARPVMVIYSKSIKATLNRLEKPFSDPESPRTTQMWKEYESWKFPAPLEDELLSEGSLHQFVMSSRLLSQITRDDSLVHMELNSARSSLSDV